ncbi:uncharacterized protein CBL_06501 [Carabus blaptoides fortunei]
MSIYFFNFNKIVEYGLALLVANTLRIFFWFGKRFEYPLLIQSIIMNVTMFIMIHLCVQVRNKNKIVQARSRVFSELDSKYFWAWTDFQSYVDCMVVFAIVCAITMYFMISVNWFIELVGFLAVFTEAMLGVPQFLRNYKSRSTLGMRENQRAWVASVSIGDVLSITSKVSRPRAQCVLCCHDRGNKRVLHSLCLAGANDRAVNKRETIDSTVTPSVILYRGDRSVNIHTGPAGLSTQQCARCSVKMASRSKEKVAAAFRKLFRSSDKHIDGEATNAGKGGPSVSGSPGRRLLRSYRDSVSPAGGSLPSSPAGIRARRLMKELKEIQRLQTNRPDPVFTVELVNDNLFEWHVRLLRVDPESDLAGDMRELGVTCIQLHIIFPENFPFAPPFMRVISPRIEKGFVMEGGAICMELLTPRGWASAYTVEAVVMQFAASIVKGQGRIARKPKGAKDFSRRSAEESFRSLVKTHEKYGWVTPALSDG